MDTVAKLLLISQETLSAAKRETRVFACGVPQDWPDHSQRRYHRV